MPGSWVRYRAATAKIKGMYGKRLKSDQYRNLLQKTSVNEVAAYLKKTEAYDWVLENVSEMNIHRSQLEELLKKKLIVEFQKICKFVTKDDEKLLIAFGKKNETEEILSAIRLIYAGKSSEYTPSVLATFYHNPDIDYSRFSACNTIDDLITVLKKSEYYELLSRMYKYGDKTDFSQVEAQMTRYYYSQLIETANKNNKRYAKKMVEAIGTQVDFYNFSRILRMKRYFNMDLADSYSYLIPYGFLLHEDLLKKMISASSEREVFDLIKETKYRKYFDENSISYIEGYVDDYLYEFNRKVLKSAESSIGVPFAYLYVTETEIKNLTFIIEGIRYQIPASDITKQLIGVKLN